MFTSWFFWVVLVISLALVANAAWALAGQFRDRFVVTNQKVYRVHGNLDQLRASMPLTRILDITVDRPVLGRVLGYGHFVFESAAQDQGLREIKWVSEIDERERLIQRVIHEAGLGTGPTTIAGAEDDGDVTTERRPLPFDPIQEASRLWGQRWDETPRMRAVTSLMRVHQLVLTELDELLRPLGLTFARYEVLVLLSFSRRGALPLGKIGERLQVHATSVTPLVKRLEGAGLIEAHPPSRGRTGRPRLHHPARASEVLQQATDAIVAPASPSRRCPTTSATT